VHAIKKIVALTLRDIGGVAHAGLHVGWGLLVVVCMYRVEGCEMQPSLTNTNPPPSSSLRFARCSRSNRFASSPTTVSWCTCARTHKIQFRPSPTSRATTTTTTSVRTINSSTAAAAAAAETAAAAATAAAQPTAATQKLVRAFSLRSLMRSASVRVEGATSASAVALWAYSWLTAITERERERDVRYRPHRSGILRAHAHTRTHTRARARSQVSLAAR
jgi:hypothetical protein